MRANVCRTYRAVASASGAMRVATLTATLTAAALGAALLTARGAAAQGPTDPGVPPRLHHAAASVGVPDHSDARRTSAAPPAASTLRGLPDAPSSEDSATTSYDVDGVRVIQRRVTANEVVAANLYLLGGTRQITAENAGIELMLLEASERGTRHYSKDVLRSRMAQLGSTIVVEPNVDWTMFGLRSIVAGFDSTWAVFADRVMAPTLDSTEVELVRAQFASAVRQRRDSPDALLDYLADSAAFAGHPYALSPAGTERSIANIRLADLRRYHAEQMVKSRMLLVVVGNVERGQVERLVRGTIARLPQGSYRWTTPPEPARQRGGVAIEARTLPTNYILGYYSGPPATSPDYQALRVATAVLGGRLFGEIRSRRNLSYAVSAPFIDRAVTAGGLYVTTVLPDTTLALMRQEITDLQNGLITEDGLERLVQQFITEYFLDNETNSDQADFLARAQLYRGNYQVAERFVDELRGVTPEDVRRVARRYMHDVRFAYIGDPAKLSSRVIERF
jgi:zinc protease